MSGKCIFKEECAPFSNTLEIQKKEMKPLNPIQKPALTQIMPSSRSTFLHQAITKAVTHNKQFYSPFIIIHAAEPCLQMKHTTYTSSEGPGHDV